MTNFISSITKLKFKKLLAFSLLCCIPVVLSFCTSGNSQQNSPELYQGFKNPPAEARPFVRWWWGDNKIEAPELNRELELLKKKGFGGVEINPVGMKPASVDIGVKSLEWMSDEWIDLLVQTCKKTKDLDMIADMIVGTGWPFGGEFLKQDETCQRVVAHFLPYEGDTVIKVDWDYLLKMYKEAYKNNQSSNHQSKNTTYELFYINLLPARSKSLGESINLKELMDKNGRLTYKIEKPGKYNLCYGVLEKNFREVSVGAPGGAGPVMDHYKKEVTYEYLSRLKRISERSGIPLHELLRALFCDSIEISGANWTDEFARLFFDEYGYELTSWIPFIFYPPYEGYANVGYDKDFDQQFKDKLKKVRYDYNQLLVKTFLDHFTQVFQDFCTEQNLLCRYQAYGTPFLMGMLDGYMIPDIPESNNWIYSRLMKNNEMKDSAWQWHQNHGYMVWNMFAASGGHLKGRKIISVESMTNTAGVFRTTLEEIKQHDDMNFITGMNHTILHGFNYSPKEAGFPGWVRFGAYFSEQNPWWEYLDSWVDYNARLSYVFQNSQASKSIAIIGPTSDIWGNVGLTRAEFHTTPWYLYKLWEPISQLGYSCEYINENVLKGAQFLDGSIQYGKMKYNLLVLVDLKSMDTKSVLAVEQFIQSGGKVVVVDQLPTLSLHFNDYEKNDEMVRSTMEEFSKNHAQSLLQMAGPTKDQSLMLWTQRMCSVAGLKPDVTIDKPSKYIYQIHKFTKDKEIYFFNNTHRYNTETFEATFPVKDKYPWIWNPETGERTPYHFSSNPNELSIKLKPLQSLLLVFENEKPDRFVSVDNTEVKNSQELNVSWEVEGQQVDGSILHWQMNKLINLTQSDDATQRNFGGKIIYKTSFINTGGFTHIDLGNVNGGTTELLVNGQNAGARWYGQAIYPVNDFLTEGENKIEIHYTTVLSNYCQSLKDNEAAQFWTRHNAKDPTGIEGPVRLQEYSQN